MNWQERINQADEHAKKLRARAMGVVIDKKRGEQEVALAERKQAQAIIERFQVSGALESIRDEVWMEGEIEDVETDSMSGVKLETQVPYINIIGVFARGGRLEVGTTTVSTTVFVNHRGDHWRGLQINDRGLFTGRTAINEKIIIEDLIQKHGVQSALEQVVRPFWFQGSYLGNNVFGYVDNLNQPDAMERFNQTLVGMGEYRKKVNSIPAQIRARATWIIEQLEPFLNGKKFIEGEELIGWERRVKSLHTIAQRRRLPFLSRFQSEH